MLIVKIIGGLGNQMFQYAYAKVMEEKGYDVKIDISTFETYTLHGGYQLDKFRITLNTSTKDENNQIYKKSLLTKLKYKLYFRNTSFIKEKTLLYQDRLLDLEDNKYIIGYFQSEQYFLNIRNTLLDEFRIKEELPKYIKKIENKIKETPSCSLHIRRGDFKNETNINIHGVCDLAYYYTAIDYLNNKFDNLQYFIFSDDIIWVKENLKINNAIYIDYVNNKIPHYDMYLMSLCNHNIIANSSYSWWGAWLNRNTEKIVIAPKKWFSDYKRNEQSKDIYCEGWLQL